MAEYKGLEKTLEARWSDQEKSVEIRYPVEADGYLLHEFIERLEMRGYDLRTFKFLIELKVDAPVMQRRFRRQARVWFRRAEVL